MFTIIIFTSNRLYEFKELFNDIIINDPNSKINLIIVSYGNTKKNNLIIKKISKKKNCRFFEEKDNLSLPEKLGKYIPKAKTKYFWWIADDDRLSKNAFDKIGYVLQKNQNISGITVGHVPLKKIKKKIYTFVEKEYIIKDFNIKKNLEDLGMNSTQIVNKEYYLEVEKFLKKKYTNKDYFYLNSILDIIHKYKKWKILKNKIIVYRLDNYTYSNEQKLNRLNSEFEGYFLPIKKKYSKKKYHELFKRVFYKNILSWILYNIKYNGKIKTYKVILQNYKLIPKQFTTLIVLFAIYFIPLFFINLAKKILEKFNFKI
jgi:hypothetical protein